MSIDTQFNLGDTGPMPYVRKSETTPLNGGVVAKSHYHFLSPKGTSATLLHNLTALSFHQ